LWEAVSAAGFYLREWNRRPRDFVRSASESCQLQPLDRDQPIEFLPGVHESVVSLKVEGKKKDDDHAIVWTLDGTAIGPDKKRDPKCKNK
jgi:hypothetical protein